MHIRIANLRTITQEAIGFAHSDCQTGEATRQPSDMHIRTANLKISAGGHRICTFGLPI